MLSPVPCNGCRLCCELPKLLVNIYLERGDCNEYESYRGNPKGGVKFTSERFVCKDENGACVYLTPDGCGIYDWRPWVCRAFDCRNWADKLIPELQNDPTAQAIQRQGKKKRAATKRWLARRFNAAMEG